MPDGNNRIGKLDFPSLDEQQTLLHSTSADDSRQPGHLSGYTGHFFEDVAEGIQSRDREELRREIVRYGSFVWAILSCLCGGSITAYSLYGHLFQSRLHYTQYQVNIVSIVAEVSLYLPVPFWGLLCDRRGPGPSSLISAFLFGAGYLLAAFTYHSGPPRSAGSNGWPFAVMVLAFVGIGSGTSAIYLAAVTTCAKNFGRSKYKGFALAAPIASFGLGGMWQSQLGSRVLYERNPDGSRGDVDVFRFFLFLGGLLLAVGIIGFVALRIVDEEELVDEAVEELERSGLLEDSEFFQRHNPSNEIGYGTMNGRERRLSADEITARENQASEEKRKKTWLLNEETRRFLSDRTMWWLAAGFFLVTGPGEAFINNLGTIIGTLYSAPDSENLKRQDHYSQTTPATHVSILAITSTVARILSGTLSDFLGPQSVPHQHRRGPASLTSSLVSLDPLASSQHLPGAQRFTVSRLTLLLISVLLFSFGQVLLASGLIQDHASRFWTVTALVGTGYGACFALVPIVVSCVWGVENFGTNWGIVAVVPAGGAAVWGAVYAAVYEQATSDDGNCYGLPCYQRTFWGMAVCSWVACGFWLWAWRGPGGWYSRGVTV